MPRPKAIVIVTTNMNTVGSSGGRSSRICSIIRGCLRLCLSALVVSVNTAFADEMWSWHVLDAKVVKAQRFEITLHSRFRTGRGEFQQGRAGVVTTMATTPNANAIAGYYYGKEEDSVDEWRNFHRVFGGFEAPVYRSKRVSLAARGLLERFFVADQSGFTRFRQRIRLTTDRRIGPYAAGEWFFVSDGWLSGRYGAGLRWRCNEWVSMEMGYLYDQRRPSVGEPRHVIVTQFTIEKIIHE